MALHGTVAEVAELGSAAFRNFGLVWRRHTKIQIGMAAAIHAKQLPAPLHLESVQSVPVIGRRTRIIYCCQHGYENFSNYSFSIFSCYNDSTK